MIKEKKIIIANWKMNPVSEKEAQKLFLSIKNVASKLLNVQTIICPPFVYLNTLNKLFKGHRIAVGAQDVFYKNTGSFTGMISADMLKDNGIKYAIVGHSERRSLGETNEIVNQKIKLLLQADIVPIVCVGEVVRDEEAKHFDFLKNEILNSLDGVSAGSLENIIIAYEPVWAISTNSAGVAMNSQDIHEMTIFTKKVLSDKYGMKVVLPKILYGGSVNVENVEDLIMNGNIDGLLVGKASLSVNDFKEILSVANKM